MSKLTIFLSIVIVYFCCIAIGYGDSTSGPSGSSGVAPKKVRVLSPSASRLYRLLRNGVKLNQIGDEDLLTEEDLFLQKRQYDDYGHMRFGKRTGNDFDDYGHLRFGK